jgi:hypothetical protein
MPFENVVAMASLFRASIPDSQRDDAMAHAIALVERAIIQQVNDANDSGRLFSRPASSARESSRQPANRQS